MEAPQVKLLTLWMMDLERETAYRKNPSEDFISNGIWETIGVEVIENRNSRYYTMRCIYPYHPDIQIGSIIKMREDILIEMCHEVKITHLPKLPSMIQRERAAI